MGRSGSGRRKPGWQTRIGDLLKAAGSERAVRGRIPIVVTTGWSPEHVRGVIADAILYKPLNVKELVRVVGRLLDAATTDLC